MKQVYNDVSVRPTESGESQAEVYDRVVPAFQKIMDDLEPEDVALMVSHYFVVKAQLSYLEFDDVRKMPIFDVRNANPIIYTI